MRVMAMMAMMAYKVSMLNEGKIRKTALQYHFLSFPVL